MVVHDRLHRDGPVVPAEAEGDDPAGTPAALTGWVNAAFDRLLTRLDRLHAADPDLCADLTGRMAYVLSVMYSRGMAVEHGSVASSESSTIERDSMESSTEGSTSAGRPVWPRRRTLAAVAPTARGGMNALVGG